MVMPEFGGIDPNLGINLHQPDMLTLIKRAARRFLSARGYQLYREGEAFPWGLDYMRDVARLVGNDPIRIFFDVGANIGQTAELALARFPEAAIFAFEPDPNSFATLRSREFDKARFECYNLAMAESGGRRILFCNGQTRNSMVFSDTGEHVEVDCSTIDLFTESHAIEQIDLLKTDTEGMDLAVLMGAQSLLSSRRVRFVFSEFFNDGTGTDLGSLLSLLQPKGFRLISTSMNSVFPNRFAVGNALFALA
jgi:FkbM family methyltransferase